MTYFVFNEHNMPFGESLYQYSDRDTASMWTSRALRRADRVFNVQHDRIYMVKDRYEGVPERVLSEEQIAWIILSATPIADSAMWRQ